MKQYMNSLVQTVVGEEVFRDEEKGSDWNFLVKNPPTFRESWKECVTLVCQQSNFVDWIYKQVTPKKKEAVVIMDMNADVNMLVGDATVGCSYKRKVVIPVPSPKYFVKVTEDGPRGATYVPVLEDPVNEATVHICSGDYFKMLDVMEKKGGTIQVRGAKIDPPWKHHPGERPEDSKEEPCSRVII